jgi:predicted DNA-binding transcriptional regulator AlpA
MESLGKHIEDALPAELPTLIGKLEEAKARAWARLNQPVAPMPAAPVSDARMVGIDEAAQRLGMSASWLYRNASKIPGATKPNGHNWRFSTKALDKYLQDRQPR